MPIVKIAQDTFAQGLDHLAQAASSLPLSNAAIANAKTTEKPTYPIYKVGG